MCTCASCSYTNSFSGRGFAEWPRGKPAGKSAARDYAAHVRYSQQWGRGHNAPAIPNSYREIVPEPRFPYSGSAPASASLRIPEHKESLAEYIAEFEKLNGLKRSAICAT